MPTTSKSDDDDDNNPGQQLQLTGIKRPGEHDVLNGRGGLANNFPGNVCYRDTVDSRKAEYVQSQRAQKTGLSWTLVRWWRGLDPPGRFLEQDESGLWNDIGDKRARRKTSQLLREDARIVRDRVGAASTDHDSEGGTDTSEDTEESTKKRATVPNMSRAKAHGQQASQTKQQPVRRNSAAKNPRKKSPPNKPKVNGLANGANGCTYVACKARIGTAKLKEPPESEAVAAPAVQDGEKMPALLGMGELNLPSLGVNQATVGGQRETSWGAIDRYLLDVDVNMSEWDLSGIIESDARGASGVPIEPLLDCLTDSTDQEAATSSYLGDALDIGMDMDNDDSGRQVKRKAGPEAQAPRTDS